MSGVPDYTLEDILDFKFTTRQFSTGAPFAFAGGVIEIYEDNSITQITGGETLTLEFDGIAGLHNLRVTASAANGFENGKSYHCVVSVGTVDSVSVVGEVVQQFSIGRSAAAADLANATDGLGAIKADSAAILLDTAEIGTAGVGLTNIGTIATVTTLTNLPAITSNWLTAAGINTGALDGKGNWNIGKTGYSLAATGLDAIVSTATGTVEIAKAIWDRVLSKANHNVAQSAGKRLRQIDASFVVTAGTAQAGAAGTITLAAGESATDDIFAGDRCIIVAGTGVGEHGIITAYNGTSKVATMSQNWVITPDVTSEYELSPADVDVETWQHATVTNSATTSLPCVDTRSISDDATAANNLELDYDGTGYAKANSTIGTTTTNTDMLTAAAVNAEVLDVMDTDTITLPGQEAPPLAPTHRQAIAWLYKVFRNRKTQTATQWSLLADDEATVDAKATVSDDATTATKQEVITGP